MVDEFTGTVPNLTQSQPDFDSNTQAFLDYVASLAPQLNEWVGAYVQDTTSTSTTSNSIGTGSKTFTVQAGKGYKEDMTLRASAGGGNFMDGRVTSYSGTTLEILATSFSGAGTFTAWDIFLSISGGATLESNTFTGDQFVPDEAYDATSWNGDLSVPTKKAIRDKIESLIVSINDIPSVRQTVLSGPVDSNGLPNFGGSTGGTTVTVSGTLRVTSSNGETDNVLDVTNPSWTGLSTNGTMYLWIDTVTGATGSTTLGPAYQFGGAYSNTNNQHTYNIQEAVMKVGNGSTATQVNRLFVGEVTVAGGVVTAIVWYAIKGRYHSGRFAATPGNLYSKNHNIGTSNELFRMSAMGATGAGGILREFMKSNNGSPWPGTSLNNDSRIAVSLLTQGDARVFTGVTNGAPVAEVVINVDRGW